MTEEGERRAATLQAASSVLVVVDLQDRLVPAIEDHEAVVARAGILVKAAEILAIPVVFTEHFPEKIGPTVAAVTTQGPGRQVFRKEHFNACDEPGFTTLMADLGRPQAIVCGTEAHVCVLQTALGLVGLGYQTAVVEDASGSRKAPDREAGFRRLAVSGVTPVTSEMVVFEWAARGGTDDFRALHALIK
ncbi:isochorismatase family protein [Microbaculum marinum]|uniref:Isochorismatase family protein n=1 Tax=Microbaculum marinum TaxID=1764581 RepID=A0AAW9RQJ1_9HYPH